VSRRHRTLGALIAATAVLAGSCGAAAAASWSVALSSSSSGQGLSQAAPSAPSAPTAVCVSGSAQTVRVGWTGVAHAASYTVYASTDGATGTYSALASGVTANPYTTSSLTPGTYTFEVAALVGGTWTSARSVASSPARTIRTNGTRCA
jgi:hypothetical protein